MAGEVFRRQVITQESYFERNSSSQEVLGFKTLKGLFRWRGLWFSKLSFLYKLVVLP